MTDLEYYRYRKQLQQLRKLEKEYPTRSISNTIQNIDARLQYHYATRKH